MRTSTVVAVAVAVAMTVVVALGRPAVPVGDGVTVAVVGWVGNGVWVGI